MNTSSFDFSQARFKHLNWKFRLRSFLDGKESITMEQAVSHHDCDLGKWLYTDGIKKYNQFSEMNELEKIHETLHATIKKVIEFKHQNDSKQAKEELKKVDSISNKIVHLLDALEKKASVELV